MKENKYRAWNRKTKKMQYFTLNTLLEGYGDDCTCTPDNEEPWVNPMWQPIMQYTGLKDKNSKEIYVGDVLKWRGYEVANGKQIRPLRTWEVQDNYQRLFQIENIIRDNGTLEIIGNIHENPELRGKTDD